MYDAEGVDGTASGFRADKRVCTRCITTIVRTGPSLALGFSRRLLVGRAVQRLVGCCSFPSDVS